MTAPDARHRAPPSKRPQVAPWLRVVVVAGVALVAGTVALASWLGPDPVVKPAAPEPPPVSRSYAVRTLPPLDLTPLEPAAAPSEPTETPSPDPLSAPVPNRGVSAYPTAPERRSTATSAPTTAQPRQQRRSATESVVTPAPAAPSTTAPPAEPTPTQQPATTPEETPVPEPTPAETAQPTAETTPTETATPTDVVEETVEDVVETPTATPIEEQP